MCDKFCKGTGVVWPRACCTVFRQSLRLIIELLVDSALMLELHAPALPPCPAAIGYRALINCKFCLLLLL